jgi:O-antigen ligase
VQLLLAHAAALKEYTLRLGIWATALRVIAAHPLIGLGMAQNIYLTAADPYRVPWQTRQVAHPHDSYLELAAFAGVPVLLAFLTLLVSVLRSAVDAYRAAPPEHRPLLGGMLVALCTLSVNSLAINGWTLPVLASLGWLLAGAAMARGKRVREELFALADARVLVEQR